MSPERKIANPTSIRGMLAVKKALEAACKVA